MSSTRSNIIMPVAPDKVSSLPNDVLGFILSKVPIREAVRCSVLSKRWRFLYTQIPRLIFSPYLLLQGSATPDPLSISMAENAISSILQSHSLDLEVFHLFNDTTGTRTYPVDNRWVFSLESVWKWVQYAADKNVQHLNLGYSTVKEIPPPALFFCTHLTTLTLTTFNLTHIPTHSSGFNHLITCTLEDTELTDDSLASLTSHCPFLQRLKLIRCSGLQKPVIYGAKISLLHIYVWDGTEALTINCPKIRIIQLSMVDDLRVNGVLFHDLSFAVLSVEMECGINVIGMELDTSFTEESYKFSAQRFLDMVGGFKALKRLEINILSLLEREKEMVVPLISLFQGLPHLESLIISGMFLLELARDRIPPSLSPALANLRRMTVEINEFDHREMTVMACLLHSAPALEYLKFDLPEKYEQAQYSRFLRELSGL